MYFKSLAVIFTLCAVSSSEGHGLKSLVANAGMRLSNRSLISTSSRSLYSQKHLATKIGARTKLSNVQSRNITSGLAALGYTVVGATTGLGFGVLMDEFLDTSIFAVLGLLAGASFIGSIVHSNTESGVSNYIEHLLKRCDANLQAIAAKNGQELIQAINAYYIAYPTPLATAFSSLQKEFDLLKNIQNNAQRLFDHTSKEEYKKIIDQCNESLNFIMKAMNEIKQHPQFLIQMNSLHNKNSADAAQTNATANSVNAAANVINVLSK